MKHRRVTQRRSVVAMKMALRHRQGAPTSVADDAFPSAGVRPRDPMEPGFWGIEKHSAKRILKDLAGSSFPPLSLCYTATYL